MSKPRYKLESSKYPGTEMECDDCALLHCAPCPKTSDGRLVCGQLLPNLDTIFVQVKDGE